MRLTKKVKETLESIKRIDEDNLEWWSSRELANILTYKFSGSNEKSMVCM